MAFKLRTRLVEDRTVMLYVLGQLVGPFLIALAMTNFLLLLLQLLQMGDVVFSRAFSLPFVAGIFIFALPHYMVITLPLASLTAVLIVFGRMADENELIALEASGVSPLALYNAPMIMGALASVVALGCQLYGEPVGMRSLYSMVVEALKDNISYNFKEEVFNDELPGTVIYFGKKSEERTWNTFFMYQNDGEHDPVLVAAKQGTVNVLPDKKGISLDLNEGVLHQEDRAKNEYMVISYRENSLKVDVGNIIDSKTKLFNGAAMMFPDELRARLKTIQQGSREFFRMNVFLHSKYATSMLPFLLMIAIVPLCSLRHRWGRSVNIGLTMSTLLVYYISVRFFSAAGETGKLSAFVAAWSPDAVLVAVAALTPFIRGNAR